MRRRSFWVLVVLCMVLFFSFSAGGEPSDSSVKFSGSVQVDVAGYFEVADFFHINISKYSHDEAEYVYSNVSNKVGVSIPVTLSFSDNVKVIKLQLGSPATLNVSAGFNTTTQIIDWGNGTVEEVARNVNYTYQLVDGFEWTDLGTEYYTNHSSKSSGHTFLSVPVGNQFLRWRLHPKGGNHVEYSVFLNTTVSGKEIVLDFDPELGASGLPIDDNLKIWFQFEGGLNDSGLDKNNLSGTTYRSINASAGYVNKGIHFDGTDEGVTTINNAFYSGQSNRTVMAWVRSNGLTTYEHWMSSGTSSGTGTSWEGRTDPDNTTTLETWSQAIGSVIAFTDRWYFVAMTANSTHWCIYVNGTINACSTASINTGANTITIGQRKFAANQDWFGDIDEVSFWNVTLNASQISAAYQNYTAGMDPLNNSGGGGGSSNVTNATETEGDNAIELAINSSVPSAIKYKTQKVYIVNSSNSQWQGTVDYYVIQSNPPKRWLLNYITTGEGYLSAKNLSNVAYVLEIANKTQANITREVSTLINATK